MPYGDEPPGGFPYGPPGDYGELANRYGHNVVDPRGLTGPDYYDRLQQQELIDRRMAEQQWLAAQAPPTANWSDSELNAPLLIPAPVCDGTFEKACGECRSRTDCPWAWIRQPREATRPPSAARSEPRPMSPASAPPPNHPTHIPVYRDEASTTAAPKAPQPTRPSASQASRPNDSGADVGMAILGGLAMVIGVAFCLCFIGGFIWFLAALLFNVPF